MNDYNWIYLGRGFDSRHLHHREQIMFTFKKWFMKKEEKPTNLFKPVDIQDGIEESLWQIKEEYDLPTEEVLNVVESKRQNIDHMHEMLSKNNSMNKEIS